MLQAPLLLYLATGYLGFALVMTMAGRFPDFGNLFPSWLVETFNPNDKTNLSPYRLSRSPSSLPVLSRAIGKL